MKLEEMTDSQKLEDIGKRIRRIEINSHIHLAIIVLGFVGLFSLKEVIKKVKG